VGVDLLAVGDARVIDGEEVRLLQGGSGEDYLLRPACEVCDLFLFGVREDDLRVPLGFLFRAICLGGSGDGFVGKKIRGRWCCWRCLLFSGEVAADVPQWTTMRQGECSVALAYAA